jgi:hypothetical protein
MFSLLFLDVACLSITLYLLTSLLKHRDQRPFPPGPPGWPIIRNLFDLPISRQWETFGQWNEKYGALGISEN